MRSQLQTLPEQTQSFTFVSQKPLTIKQMLKAINLLKVQGYEVIKAKFGLSSDRLRKKLSSMIDSEENDIFYQENGQKEKTCVLGDAKLKENGQPRKGCLFPIGSHLRSEIFLEAYRSNLDELQKSSQVKIYKLGDDLFIERRVMVKPESIVFCEMMDMYKGLKVLVFYNEPEIYDALETSTSFTSRLEKKGIFCKKRSNLRKNVAFYSKTFLPQEIRKEVLKQKPVQPTVLNLHYDSIFDKENEILFGLFSRSVKAFMDYLKEIHELQIEANPKVHSLMLYTSHQSFASAPLLELSSALSNIFLLSFALQNSRQFANMIKRSGKFYPFIKVIRWKKMVYCFIDSLKIGSKKNLLDTFFCFLGELNKKTRLKFYIKHNSQVQTGSVATKILNLAQRNNLLVCNQQKEMSKQINVISIKCKCFSTEQKRQKRQFEFGSFLLNALIPEGQDNTIKFEEIKQYFKSKSILNVRTKETRSFQKVQPSQILSSKKAKQNLQETNLQETNQSSDSDMLFQQESEDEQISESRVQESIISKL